METPIFSIRSSSWGDLFDCAFRWEGRNLLGMTQPATGAAQLGTATHAGTREYDQHRVDNDPITTDDAVGVFVDELRNPKQDVERTPNDLSLKDSERIGGTLVRKYCRMIAPRYTYRAVEIRPEPLDVSVGGITIRLTGQLDRLRIRASEGGNLGVADIKTGKTAVSPSGEAKTKGHGLQLGVYELLAEYSLGERISLPATIIGLQTTGKTRAGIGYIKHPRAGLIGSSERPGLIQMAAQMLKSGIFPPNPQSMFCHPRYCPRWNLCPYHG